MRYLGPSGAVYPDTLKNLLEAYGLTLDSNGLADLQASLVDLYQMRLAELCDRDQLITPMIDDLKDCKARLNQIALKKPGWKAVSKSLQKI